MKTCKQRTDWVYTNQPADGINTTMSTTENIVLLKYGGETDNVVFDWA